MSAARRGTQQAIVATSSTVASVSASFPGAVTVGDFVVVGVVQNSTAGDTTLTPLTRGVTDNQSGNVYARDQIGSRRIVNGVAAIYSCPNVAAAGTFTVTYTGVKSDFMTVVISEYSGMPTTTQIDVRAGGGSAIASSTYQTETSPVPSQADVLVVAMVANESSIDQDILTLSPFTTIGMSRIGSSGSTGCFSDRIFASIADQQCVWTGESCRYDACLVVYKALTTGRPYTDPGAPFLQQRM